MSPPPQKPHRSKQDYATPAVFLEAVKRRLGIAAFGFDFAADADNTTAAAWWSVAENALAQPAEQWAARCRDDWGWLNPPFATLKPWAARCAETKRQGGRLALLVPAAVGADWFRNHVDGYARVLLLNGRLAFMPDKPRWLYPKDCVLALYAPAVLPGYEVWTWKPKQLVGKAKRVETLQASRARTFDTAPDLSPPVEALAPTPDAAALFESLDRSDG